MALRLKLKPKPLTNLRYIQHFSSFSSSLPPPPSNGEEENSNSTPTPPPPPSPPSYSSYFSDIKERLKQSPPSPPRRIPANPSPPRFSAPKPSEAVSLDEIRKNLAEFRLRSQAPSSSSTQKPPSSPSPFSFQELYKKNSVLGKNYGDGTTEKSDGLSLDKIRESLRQFKSSGDPVGTWGKRGQSQSPFITNFKDSMRGRLGDSGGSAPLIGGMDKLPVSIFGRELQEKNADSETETKGLKTEFVKMYSYAELGEKLKKLRPAEAAKAGQDWFSLHELNERLAKLRELEEKETESRLGGVSFKDLRESLVRLKDADASKKASRQRLSIIGHLGGQVTPTFMLKPPQEHLVENFFHPDHMSSEEKMKLQLKKVREEFKMSDSDCGSARVQVAQLTTKIKHLSGALHKKDKHSRKGLQDMVQRRKRLLKYLRRTDWDSYCFVLAKLGLRDVPNYKI